MLISELYTLKSDLNTKFWRISYLCREYDARLPFKKHEFDQLSLEFKNELVRLYKLDRLVGNHAFQQFIRSASYRNGYSKLVELLVSISFHINDKMIHHYVSRAVVSKLDVNYASNLLTRRTNTPVDLRDVSTIKPDHITAMNTIIKHMGMNDMYMDCTKYKNLFLFAEQDPILLKTLEDHMLMKARRYKNFWNLTQYILNFPSADKKRFFLEIFKNRDSWSARAAINRIKNDPDLKRYFIFE